MCVSNFLLYAYLHLIIFHKNLIKYILPRNCMRKRRETETERELKELNMEICIQISLSNRFWLQSFLKCHYLKMCLGLLVTMPFAASLYLW